MPNRNAPQPRGKQQENEDEARRILVVLHPVVQRLLQVLRDINAFNSTTSGRTRGKSEIQQLMRVLHELFVQYRERLERVLSSSAAVLLTLDSKLQNMLLEYCLQPCLAAYKVLADDNSATTLNSDYTKDESHNCVLEQTIHRKVWMESAQTLLYLFKRFEGWTASQRVQVVQSHVTSLPPTQKGPTLDQQGNIWRTYFDLLARLWEGSGIGPSSSEKELVQTLIDVWPQGALVARIAETCLEALPDTPVESLHCLKLWIEQVSPQPQLWKRLFPGVFHGVYRTVTAALLDFRQTHKGLAGLEALTALCRAVTLDRHSSINEGSKRRATQISGQDDVLEAMQAWKLSSGSGHSKGSASSSKKQGDNNLPEKLFWTRVAQNLALPLQRLIIQCYGHDSEQMRIQSLFLSKLIQQEWQTNLDPVVQSMEASVRQAWEKLQDAVIDGTVRLRQQSDPTVQSHAEQVLQGTSRDYLLRSRLFERWKSIWEDVTGLTSGQRWLEWSHTLQLLQGYLPFLDRRDVRLFLKNDARVLNLWRLLWIVDLRLLTYRWRGGSAGGSRLALPWKYLSGERLGQIESVVRSLGEKIGMRSSAILVDEMVVRCADKVISSAGDVTVLAEAVPLLVVSGLALSTMKYADTKGSRSIEMLVKTTLPVVISIFDQETSSDLRDSKEIACLDTCALRWLSILFEQGNFQSTLHPICLFPVLVRQSCSKWDAVKFGAEDCLRTMSAGNGPASNVQSLVAESMESLLGTALVRLRTGSGSQRLKETIKTSAACLRLGHSAFKKGDQRRLLVTLSQVNEVLLATVESFDRWAVFAGVDNDMTGAYVDFFGSAITSLNTTLGGVQDSAVPQTTTTSHLSDDRWIRLLDEFRIDTKTEPDESKAECPVQGQVKEYGSRDMFATRKETDLVARVVSIATYLLSHSELRVQSEACKLLSSCFDLLLVISELPAPKQTEEELNGAKNAILRHIADCWPSLAARTNAIVRLLRDDKEKASLVISAHAVDKSPSLNFGEMRVFMSRVLDLVSTMVEASDDFMASRVRETVWPWLDQVLFDASRDIVSGDEAGRPSVDTLLQSALTCISRIYRHRPTGVVLSELIPKIGSRLIPLLDMDERMAFVTVETIRSLLQIDSDALLRPLHTLAGQPLERSPFLETPSREKNSNLSVIRPPNQAEKHARSLLKAMDDLAEQEIQ